MANKIVHILKLCAKVHLFHTVQCIKVQLSPPLCRIFKPSGILFTTRQRLGGRWEGAGYEMAEFRGKAWSWRSLRWMEQMPESLRSGNISLKAVKKELKAWVKHHIPVRGDRILWGRPLTGIMKRRKAKESEPNDEEGAGEVVRHPEGSPGTGDNMEPIEPEQINEQDQLNVQRMRDNLDNLISERRKQSNRKHGKIGIKKVGHERRARMQVEARESQDEGGKGSGEGPRLPCSLAAAVKASLYESRETWTPGDHPPGEIGGRIRTVAAVEDVLQVEGEGGLINNTAREPKADKKCKRLKRLVWSVKEEMCCYHQCNMIRQGGHRGAVGRVKCGEG